MALENEETGDATPETPPEETTIRDALESAFDAADAAQPSEKPEAPAGEQSAPPEGEQAARAAKAARARDEKGRFQPKIGEQPGAPAAPAAAAGEQPAAAAGEQPPKGTPYAPASWSPAEREAWETVPPAAKEAIARRELEINRALQETTTSRRALESLQGVVSPYLQNIRAANGGDVVGAMKQFFEYDNRLRHGTQLEKAQAITALIKGYGVDIQALDNSLAGAAPNPQHAQQSAAAAQQAAVQRLLQQELAPFRQMMQAQQQATAGRINQTIEQFATDPKNKHFAVVQGPMADLLELAERQNRQMSLQDAYDAACWQNPEIRTILLKEVASQSAGTGTQAAQRARAVAVGIKSGPRATLPGAGGNANNSRLDDLAAAFDKHANAT